MKEFPKTIDLRAHTEFNPEFRRYITQSASIVHHNDISQESKEMNLDELLNVFQTANT